MLQEKLSPQQRLEIYELYCSRELASDIAHPYWIDKGTVYQIVKDQYVERHLLKLILQH